VKGSRDVRNRAKAAEQNAKDANFLAQSRIAV